ncbi:MAG: hypothetical protein DYG99_09885 [Bacteroidetes bacterium CHB5]|nr:hypothetical protein [Bacteroidetes bacterium CHB5]
MKTIAFVLFLFPLFVIAQIGAKTQSGGKLSGIWQNNQFGYQMTLMLNADGSGEFDGEPIRYSSQATKLSIIQNGQTTVYTFSLQGNSLTLSGGDLDNSIVFTRNGTQNAPATVQNQPQQYQQPQNNVAQNGAEVVGVWSGNGESLEFRSNGQCIYLGNTFQYQVSQGHIILQTPQGNVMMAYTVKGNQLTVSANGQQFTYTKGAGNGGQAPTQTQAQAGGGHVAQELVGKWCWTNVNSTNTGGSSSSECIVLNANGTYQYASERSMDTNTNSFYAGTSSQSNDQGTWWVQGDRIYYNSQTRGQGSYQLQKQNHPKTGDPMIVLDGEPYVTFYQKPRW